MLRRITTVLAWICCCAPLVAGASAQERYWPHVLMPPGSEEPVEAVEDTVEFTLTGEDTVFAAPGEPDSTTLSLTSITSLRQIFKTRTRLDWGQTLEGASLYQYADYQFVRKNDSSSIQFCDLSGVYTRDRVFIDGLSAGLEWSPIVSYRKQPTSALQSSIDVGPILSHSLFTIPYTIRGGAYGYAWNDSIVTSLHATSVDDYHAAPGVYGGCEIGNPEMPVGSLPLFISVNALGRALNGNNLGLFGATALYADKVPFTRGSDSLFIYLSDSVTNGKELYIGEFEGKPFYSNTSWRINHSFAHAIGIRTEERFGAVLQLYYRYYLSSISYPSSLQALDDSRTTGQVFGVGLATNQERRLSYQGGIEFDWRFEDQLFRQKFDGSANLQDRDLYIRNLSDYYSDIARSDHVLRLKLPWGITVKDSIHAFKDSKKYPFVFLDTSFTGK